MYDLVKADINLVDASAKLIVKRINATVEFVVKRINATVESFAHGIDTAVESFIIFSDKANVIFDFLSFFFNSLVYEFQGNSFDEVCNW